MLSITYLVIFFTHFCLIAFIIGTVGRLKSEKPFQSIFKIERWGCKAPISKKQSKKGRITLSPNVT